MDVWIAKAADYGRTEVRLFDAGRIDPEASACWLAPQTNDILFFGTLDTDVPEIEVPFLEHLNKITFDREAEHA